MKNWHTKQNNVEYDKTSNLVLLTVINQGEAVLFGLSSNNKWFFFFFFLSQNRILCKNTKLLTFYRTRYNILLYGQFNTTFEQYSYLFVQNVFILVCIHKFYPN